jgi:uncharacterized membrane protein YdbT with pleckstrin-like domain
MGYPTKLLTDNEEVKLDVHPHWSALAPAVEPLIVLVAITAGLGAFGWVHGLGEQVLDGLWVVVVLFSGWKVASYYATDFVVTTTRIIYRHGVIGRQSEEIPLTAITNTLVTRGIIERFLGNGTLIVESAGRDSKERFLDIAHTERVHRLILQLMEDRRDGGGERAGTPGGDSHADSHNHSDSDLAGQLERLAELHATGKLTDEEFAAAKGRLLP